MTDVTLVPCGMPRLVTVQTAHGDQELVVVCARPIGHESNHIGLIPAGFLAWNDDFAGEYDITRRL